MNTLSLDLSVCLRLVLIIAFWPICPLSDDRVDSGSEFPGLKTTVFDHFWAVFGAYKRHTPLPIGLLSPQICTDLRGVKNPWKIGGNPPIGGKKSTLDD